MEGQNSETKFRMNSISSSFIYNAAGLITIYLFVVLLGKSLDLYAKHKKLENNAIINQVKTTLPILYLYLTIHELTMFAAL